jgi:ankyrin repeat protein
MFFLNRFYNSILVFFTNIWSWASSFYNHSKELDYVDNTSLPDAIDKSDWKKVFRLLEMENIDPFIITLQEKFLMSSLEKNAPNDIIYSLLEYEPNLLLEDEFGANSIDFLLQHKPNILELLEPEDKALILEPALTYFINLVKDGQLDKAQNLKSIFRELDVNRTPLLWYAIRYDNENILAFLLKNGLRLDVVYNNINILILGKNETINKLTPLHLAVIFRSEKMFEFLLAQSCVIQRINAVDSTGTTALIYALERNAPNCIIQSLVLKSFSSDITETMQDHPELMKKLIDTAPNQLWEQANCYGGELLNFLLINDKNLVSTLKQLDTNPLILALKRNNEDNLRNILKVLVEHEGYEGVLNAPERGSLHQTVLLQATFFAKWEVAILLLGIKGISVNSVDYCNNSPLIYALRNKAPDEVIRMILEKKPNMPITLVGRTNIIELICEFKPNILEIVSPEAKAFTLKSVQAYFNNLVKDGQLDKAQSLKSTFPEIDVTLSLLLHAMKHDNSEILNFLLENGIGLNVICERKSREGEESISNITTLHLAVMFKGKRILQLLLKQPWIIQKINATDSKSNTALNLALITKQWEIAKLLLGVEGLDINIADNKGKTPLMHALMNEAPYEIIRKILDIGPNLLSKDIDDKDGIDYIMLYKPTLINLAYTEENEFFTDLLNMLLARNPVEGLIAIAEEHLPKIFEIIKLIFPNQIKEIARKTLMLKPLSDTNSKLLLEQLSTDDLNIRSENGNTLLSCAIRNKAFGFATILREKGAKVEFIPNYIAERLLICCTKANQNKLLESLLYGEASQKIALLGDPPNERNNQNVFLKSLFRPININITSPKTKESLLMTAIRYHHIDIVKLLLSDARTNAGLIRSDGNTALTLAVFSRNPEIIKEVLKHKDIWHIANNIADKPRTNFRGTALHMAVAMDEQDITEELFKLDGIDPTISQGTSYERTPLMWAAEQKNVAMVNAFLDRFPGLDMTQRDASGKSTAFYVVKYCPYSLIKKWHHHGKHLLREFTNKETYNVLYVEMLEKISSTQNDIVKQTLENITDLLKSKTDLVDALLYALHSGYNHASNAILSSLTFFHNGHERLALPLDRDSISHIKSFLPNLDKKDTQGKTAFQLALNLGYYGLAARLLQAGAVDLGRVSTEQFANIFQEAILSNQGIIRLFLRLVKDYGIGTNKVEYIQNAATLLLMDKMRLDILSKERIKSVFIKLLAAGEVEAVEKVLPQIPLSILSKTNKDSVPCKIQSIEGAFYTISRREEALASIDSFTTEDIKPLSEAALPEKTSAISVKLDNFGILDSQAEVRQL